MAEFTHLHVHTQYSLLDGAIRVKDLFPRIKELGMDSVAVTDHGNMFGAIDLYTEAKAADIKLIFGCETYVASSDRHDRTNRRNYHLVLLAKNEAGYKNLSYLNSMGYLEGFYYNPRIDKQLLRDHSEGLIGMSACLGGEVAQTLEKHGVAAAEEVAREYKAMFGAGDFYLELMPTQTPEQQQLNDELKRMGPKLGIPLVVTNDCHYVNRSDAAAHDVLMAIQTGKSMKDDKRLKHSVDSYYLKSPSEMNAEMRDCPEALENAVRIAQQCNVKLKFDQTYLPTYKVPDGQTLDTYLSAVIDQGLQRRFTEMAAMGKAFDVDQYRERCKHELGVIQKMGFSGYFLIVWDFINWAKEHGIPVGPGRGSGAGSAVAWAMRITDINPIEFKLLFERFLNPERISMPDFDVDFCMNRRDEVIKYVQGKYGVDRVGQIATFHQLKARGVIRDIARVMDIPFAEADKLAKLVPEPVQGKSPPVREAIEAEPELKKLYNESPLHRELLDIAAGLEGLNRHAGMHAAGVVIAEHPLWEYVPCFRGQNGEIVTQYAMKEVEKAGLVKFDFLGLKTLTVIQTAVGLINAAKPAGATPLDIALIPMDDPDVYKMISRGDTTGVFQLESSGFREILKKLKPDNIEDIVAAVALYRPGPLEGGMVDDFIDRKHGKKKVEFPHPDLAGVLADTYGVIVYQEQVMQIAQVLAGYSLGRADLLRRAMGKKKKEIMDAEKAGFVDGAKAKGVDVKIADSVFELIAFFAGYGFNRSHSAAYAWVTYQTAYLKCHYPHEFMAGLMSCDADNIDNIVKFIAEARAMGLIVERPDLNESQADFSVVARGDGTKVIRFGMGAVKGVGAGAVEAILEARRAEDGGGRFSSTYDLCKRVDSQKCNRRVLEQLIKAGAFDGLAGGHHRAEQTAVLDAAIERGAAEQRDRRSGQTSLFGMFDPAPAAGAGGAAAATPQGELYPETEPWSHKQLLAFEKEALGFYISGHPLDRYRADLQRYANATTVDFHTGRRAAGDAAIGGVVAQYREMVTKKGDKMARYILEDAEGSIEVVCFPKTFEKVRHVLVSDEPILCSGTVKNEGTAEAAEWKMLLETAVPLSELRQSKTTRVDIHLDADRVTPEQLEALRGILEGQRGNCAAVVRLRIGQRSETVIPLGSDYSVAPSDELLARLERLFGDRVATFA
ncbi:MAG: DNA polymerase III subunit alpha [Kofleriaceae bacterium]|nr:DNA polymerase III subunit alpha [Kofleriaceae bacterium]MBP6837953.1 DNA polymerase III subunit alpha [Kofleriaceae bacterium]MBP9203354.1 DNA polymerase III subunit alpha [Kofleriaceae bacterium]